MRINKNFWPALALAALAGPAAAQTAIPAGAAGNAAVPGVNADQLEEIIVTAQRRAEDVQHAALAIDVVAPSKGSWSVVAFINNLDDKRPYGSAYYDSTMGVIGASVGAPRIWGVRGTYRF
jgi:hypothetical protein